MKLGVCYYPEHWPEARWAVDARLMRDLGLNVVRLAEFAWARLEPAAGRFEWDWLDRAIVTLSDAGLEVVLGTPTAAPPAWLSRGHPETLPVDDQGRRRDFGGRRHYCPNSPVYQECTRRIVTALGQHYGADARVTGWQIDNEFGGGNTARCYCPNCAAAFRVWLRARYGSLDTLNANWGNVFWSQIYTDWAQINPPVLVAGNHPSPSHMLDYYRFSSDSVAAYQQIQLDSLRPHARPGQWVTHNFMGLYPDLNYFDLARPLDLVTWDSYPTGNADRWRDTLYGSESTDAPYAAGVGDPAITGLAHDLTRGLLGKPFWIMEQQAGHINWGAYNPALQPGTVRLWTWHALGAGADAVVYFRWRACLYAQEQYHSGLLHHDATPDLGQLEVEALRPEREQMARLAAQPVRPQVAVLFAYDDLWALQLQPHNRDFGYLRHLFVFYRALQSLGIPVDVIGTDVDLSGYRLVLAPTAHLGDEQLAGRLMTFARQGGTALLGVRSGFKTSHNMVIDQPLPGCYRELVGTRVVAWQSLAPGTAYEIDTALPNLAGAATLWAEALELEASSTRPLARYRSGPLAGQAALVENAIGAGRALYLGWHPSAPQAAAVMAHLAIQASVARLAELPPGLVAAQRGQFTLLLNFTDGPLTALCHGQAHTVPPRDVIVISASNLDGR